MNTQGHILVVDDDAEIRSLVAEYLTRNGYRVSMARDGAEMGSASWRVTSRRRFCRRRSSFCRSRPDAMCPPVRLD